MIIIEKYHAFKQCLDHKVWILEYQNLMLLKLSLEPHFRQFPTTKFEKKT